MAAEIIASTILNVLFEKLADEALKKLARSKGIHSELGRLKATLTEIQALLNDASRKEIADEAVKIWLDSFQHVAYDIDDVLDGLATEARHQEMMTTHESSSSISTKVKKLITPACCASLSLSNRLHHKLDIINTKLQQLENRKSDLGLILVKDEKPKTKSNRIQTSLAEASTIIGREEDKEKLLLKLLVDEPREVKFSVVPLVGLGGVGKTTLARLLYNETRVNDHFELKSWVCVSDEFDVFKISETIFRSVTGEDRKFEDLNELQMDLREQLKDKRFLLVFDDVWSESYDEWENLVRPFHSGALGSKIIITTRKESLLRKLGFDRLDHLRSLSHDHAVSLFVEHALGVHTFDLYPGLKPLGEGIVKKCGGLPLALKAMGRLLRTKTNEEEWNDVLNSEIWDLESVDEIVPALRLSYHDLPAYLKQLFAYCSLFPKDFVFDKEKLVLLWMAEGYLKHSPAGSKSPERLGNEYFQLLLSRSFFQQDPNDESLFVMHDLMNDLATFVAGEFFIRFDNQRGMENETLAKYRHMSFIREEYIGYQKFEAFKRAKSLRTFFVVSGARQSRGAFHLSNKILIDLLPGLTLLRVLSLSHSNIKEVEFIGSLKHLRYLNLSHTEIRELPENVGNLINLQTLIVFGCLYLYKLPKSFLRLNNLRHFDAGDTWLIKKMPLGIGGLKNLQTLTKIIIEGNDGFAINELK
uniref:putative disease resistance RPP13-like protein 1 n=1 Tax=Erigeron canadensis TaxID=72917 RepID=UPI001CB8E115|nr:putative disease resistance RPP13-like protein 1 [Erigeron canadensis]